jgi:methionyl-tRNA formyltransferase
MAIGADEQTPELAARLSESGSELMVETLRGLVAGKLTPRPQDNRAASYAPILKREDGLIDWNRPAQEIYNRMRGFSPWPGAFTQFRGQACHLWGRPASGAASNDAPGTLTNKKGRLEIACGAATVLELMHVKLEGRKQVSAAEFANGARLQPAERFGKA